MALCVAPRDPSAEHQKHINCTSMCPIELQIAMIPTLRRHLSFLIHMMCRSAALTAKRATKRRRNAGDMSSRKARAHGYYQVTPPMLGEKS